MFPANKIVKFPVFDDFRIDTWVVTSDLNVEGKEMGHKAPAEEKKKNPIFFVLMVLVHGGVEVECERRARVAFSQGGSPRQVERRS